MGVRVWVHFGTGFDLDFPSETLARQSIARLAEDGIAAEIAAYTMPRLPLPPALPGGHETKSRGKR